MSYTTGNVAIHNEKKDITPEYVLREANELWAKCRATILERKIQPDDRDAAHALMSELRQSNKEFCMSYPIVIRYMCEMRLYHSRAFEKFLRRIEKQPWRSESEYLDAQADYVMLLYKHTNARFDTKAANNVRKNVRELLQKEHDLFKEQHKKIMDRVESKEQILRERSAAELIEYFRKLRADKGLPPAPTGHSATSGTANICNTLTDNTLTNNTLTEHVINDNIASDATELKITEAEVDPLNAK